MAPFRAPGADEFTGTEFLPLAEDTYRVRIQKYEVKSGKDTVGQYNPDGNPRVWFYLEPLFIEGDEEALMVDTADEEISEDKFVIFFFDPDHLGTRPVVSRSRKFLAAALNVDVEQPVEAASLEEFADSLIDRELVVDLTVTKDGRYNNVADSKPVVKKTRKRKATEESDMTEVAKAVFNEGSEEDPF